MRYVIGTKGKTLQELRSRFMVDIRTPPRQEEVIDEESLDDVNVTIELSGDQSGIDAVKKEIYKIVREKVSILVYLLYVFFNNKDNLFFVTTAFYFYRFLYVIYTQRKMPFCSLFRVFFELN